jgi:amino acid adenylation domain-containing protein
MTTRSIGTIVAILSILKSGAAYVPVDPTFPADRQAHIFSHSRSLLLIVDEHTVSCVKDFETDIPPVLVISAVTGQILSNPSGISMAPPAFQLYHAPNPYNLAYVLYTSGSTGKPKGVMVLNHSVVNIVKHFATELGASERDVVLGLTTLCFDISVLETFLPLFVGGALVIASSATQKNPYRIADILVQHRVSVMQATPTTYEMLLSTGWNGSREVAFLVGGEACRPQVTQRASNCRVLLNVYGPTETTIWSTSFAFPPGPWPAERAGRVPVGRPISATYLYLVDEKMQLVPEGEGEAGEPEGELLIGGQGVALGYLHAPELTVQRFLPNPFLSTDSASTESGFPYEQRVYRTGDLVRRLRSGEYLFVRRLDDQVKLNGSR